MEKKIKLTIDKVPVSVAPGTTILDAAKSVGIDIPTLCHIDLKGTCVKNNPASCRICVVEVEGRRNLAPSCATQCMAYLFTSKFFPTASKTSSDLSHH